MVAGPRNPTQILPANSEQQPFRGVLERRENRPFAFDQLYVAERLAQRSAGFDRVLPRRLVYSARY